MTGRIHRRLTVLALCAGLGLAGCTSGPESTSTTTWIDPPGPVPAGEYQLIAFDTCDSALAELRKAAKAHVKPWGFEDARRMWMNGGAVEDRAAVPGPPGNAGAGAGGAEKGTGNNYTGTNTHEIGVDEPDLVKTDGQRIVALTGMTLRVVDASSRRVTGRLDFTTGTQRRPAFQPASLLLAGDHALIMGYGYNVFPVDTPATDQDRITDPAIVAPVQTTLLLVDLRGQPRIISEYATDGQYVDARQVGSTARIVIRSSPRIQFPYQEQGTDNQRIERNRKVIDQAGPDLWLPRHRITTGGQVEEGRLDCGALSRPKTFTGTSLLTILSVDLGRDRLTAADQVAVAADGDTVYSNGTSLYVANQDYRTAKPRTELYRFDTTGPGRPRFVAGGSVGGRLLNQYSMSEWDGKLRVATTSGEEWSTERGKSESAVSVLATTGRELRTIGQVTGLGKGERIYSVRFVGPIGYVVTFRQTDPLYTIDLRDPASPKVLGELKITGYSAYLHPAGDGKLIGVGQEATEQGRVRGTQVSLFDLTDPAKPARTAQFHLADAVSQAEFDPHAFLYLPTDGTLVIPIHTRRMEQPHAEALVLRIGDGSITKLGEIAHPGTTYEDKGSITRSLIIDGTLWTLSPGGLLATNRSDLTRTAWVPFQ